jgi:hypothetical protein
MAEIIHVDRADGTALDQAERDRLPDWPRSRGTSYDAPPRRPRLDGRIWLAMVVLIGGAIFYLFVRFVDFLSDASYQTRWLDAWIVAAFKITPLIFIAIGAYWLYNKARVAGLVRLQNNMPVHRRHIEQERWQPVAVGSLQAFYATEQEWARHSSYRSLNTLDLSQSGARSGEQEHRAPAPDGPPALDLLPPAEWLAWFDESPHVILAAQTNKGKSTTAKAILARRIETGSAVLVLDPHSSEWLGLPSIGGGDDWTAIRQAMDAVFNEYTRRLQERDTYQRGTGKELAPSHFRRLTVLLDEANHARMHLDSARRTEISAWQQFAQVLGSGARKVNISILLLAQSANVDDLGISATMRRNFTRLALDHATCRQLIQQDEGDPARRRQLYAALEGQAYPAVAAKDGTCYVLDRTGLNRLTRPSMADVDAAVWERASDLARSHPGAGTDGDETPQNEGAVWDGDGDAPLTDAERLALLVQLRRDGVSREDARGRLAFRNEEWTEAGRIALSRGRAA